MTAPQLISPDQFLAHWQGHRRLTRRLIERFPEDQLWSFTIGGMRSFGVMVKEMITVGVPMLKGIVTGEWVGTDVPEQPSKAELLAFWDADTATINEYLPKVTLEMYQEHKVAFGQYPGLAYSLLLYGVDNEIHHRGQGYVYLRALGVEPPAFYERA